MSMHIPTPYPDYAAQVRATTQHGQEVSIRHIKPADAHLLAELYRQLSPESRRLRFMTTMPEAPAELIQARAQRLAQIDPLLEAALIVTADVEAQIQAVGVARLSRADALSLVAEAAIVLRDDYQEQGLGTLLFDLLLQLAIVRGLEQVCIMCFAENAAMQRLVKKSGLPYTSETSHGETLIMIELVGKASREHTAAGLPPTTVALA